MPYYRVYLIDGQSRIVGGFDLDCENDQLAHDQAVKLSEGRPWELWRGAHRIDGSAGTSAKM
jgi:hypothetical protein